MFDFDGADVDFGDAAGDDGGGDVVDTCGSAPAFTFVRSIDATSLPMSSIPLGIGALENADNIAVSSFSRLW